MLTISKLLIDIKKIEITSMPTNVVIEAIAYELPPHIITSLSIEEQFSANLDKFGIPLGSMERLTGIKERRFWDAGTAPSEVATLALFPYRSPLSSRKTEGSRFF